MSTLRDVTQFELDIIPNSPRIEPVMVKTAKSWNKFSIILHIVL